MPKIAKEMGALEVSRLRTDGEFAVGGVQGLYLRVQGEARYWLLRYRMGERRHKLGIGPFPTVTLAMAREKAREARQKIHNGLNPLSDRVQQRAHRELAAAKRLVFRDAAHRCIKA